MANTCRGCRWARISFGDPTVGMCLYGSVEAGEDSVVGGQQQRVLKGKAIKLTDDACEYFEKKPSKAERLKEGY